LIFTLTFIAILVCSLFFVSQTYWLPKTQAVIPEFYVGIQYGYDNVTQCRALVDQVKNYTNLFVIGSGVICHNETLLNETCDYVYDAGLFFSVYFSPYQLYSHDEDPQAMPLNWIQKAQAKYGDRFVGAFVFDEPGGKQIDRSVQRMISSAADYRSAESAYVETLAENISRYAAVSDTLLTADYGLYWFDYLAGYDVVLADLGFGGDTQLQLSLCRGAAKVQNRDWGTMITWQTSDVPEIETGAELYNDLVLGYECGAKYEVVFDYGEYAMRYEYGILNQTHFDALSDFWNYVQQHPNKYGSLKADTAMVLPASLGSAFRNPLDSYWGIFSPDKWAYTLLSDIDACVQAYGPKLDIVYNDTQYNNVTTVLYPNLITWPSTNSTPLLVRNLNNTLSYASIQEAISSGATCKGDVLSVQAGTYHENVLVNKPLSLVGADGEATVIDAGKNGSAITILSNSVSVSGFTVQNAGGDGFNAGIYL
jgi:hypothetical protein